MSDSTAPTDDVWTVQRILQWTADFLQQKEVESPRLEAELMLAHARNCQRIRLYTDFETPLADDERARMRDFVKRRAGREPLAYITGRKEFYGRDFAVGSGVLVPRPETETLIDVCLEHIPPDQAVKVCEVGFGSGCIAVTLAKQCSRVSVDATDVSSHAMSFATQNVANHEVGQQVTLFEGDGFGPLPREPAGRFDGIVSNPPYIREDEMAMLMPEVAVHEPREALVSGADGLVLVRRLVSEAVDWLTEDGWMVLELDPAQCERVVELFRAAGFAKTAIHQDLSGNDRVVSAERS
ncbi:MAG: peptide chain release factor N(5)-glutamine methyltransferase [Fuerstiella sp.]|nr:peptide chain release factor N(5)-glutamine methyltransferase [Fuerstiella sp.]MCP4853584.1 peptide chain release factor N(5)-glutamine methyltransferase [Fuerstiella sp.]